MAKNNLDIVEEGSRVDVEEWDGHGEEDGEDRCGDAYEF